MNKTMSLILLGIFFYTFSLAQQIPYGYKYFKKGNILSNSIIIRDGYILDSIVNVGVANRTFSFDYNKDGKLKRDINISRYLDRMLVNGRWIVKYMPGTRDYYYNPQGNIDSVDYGHWNDSSWVNDTSVMKNQYSQDGKTLSTTYLSKGVLMNETENCYDSIGNLISSKYRTYGNSGSVGDTTYSFFIYDSQNRLTLIKTYDIMNWGHVGQYIYQHDSSGTIIRIAQGIDTSITSITSDSSIISIDTTYGSKIIFGFDETGKIIDEISWGLASTTADTSSWIFNSSNAFHYDENDRILNIWNNNDTIISFHYNNDGNLDSMVDLYIVFPFYGITLIDSYGNSISTETSGHNYYYYSSLVTSVKLNNSVIREFTLSQNYPNPFNPTTTISFSLPSKSVVSLKIFDMLGREITTIVNNEMLSVGNYSKKWNAQGCCSGVYFYRLQAGTFIETKKLILLR